jgi:hypothetical protein
MRSKIGVIVLPNCTDTLYQTLELATGRWISPGTPISSNNITDCHDIVEILFKGELNTISIINHWLFLLHKCTDTRNQILTYLVLFNCTNTRQYIGIFTIGNCLLNLIPCLFYDDFRQPMATSGFPQIVYLYGRLYRYDSEY